MCHYAGLKGKFYLVGFRGEKRHASRHVLRWCAGLPWAGVLSLETRSHTATWQLRTAEEKSLAGVHSVLSRACVGATEPFVFLAVRLLPSPLPSRCLKKRWRRELLLPYSLSLSSVFRAAAHSDPICDSVEVKDGVSF